MFTNGGLLVLADALPLLCCLVDALPPVLLGGWSAAVVVLFGGCFATISCFVLATVFCAGPALRVAFVWVESLGCPPCVACCYLYYRCVFSLVCVFLQYFSFISPLCSCIGQALFDRIKIVYITAFFLMKNMFKHGCEKKHS